MARGKDEEDRERIFLSPGPTMRSLDELVTLGTFGTNRAEVALYLVRRGIEGFMSTGVLKARPPKG